MTWLSFSWIKYDRVNRKKHFVLLFIVISCLIVFGYYIGAICSLLGCLLLYSINLWKYSNRSIVSSTFLRLVFCIYGIGICWLWYNFQSFEIDTININFNRNSNLFRYATMRSNISTYTTVKYKFVYVTPSLGSSSMLHVPSSHDIVSTKKKSNQINQFDLILKPKSFSIFDLPFPIPSAITNTNTSTSTHINQDSLRYERIVQRVKKDSTILQNITWLSKQLCLASFTLDISSLKYLLYDIGISPNSKYLADANRTALHCLSVIGTMTGGHDHAQMFSILRGEKTFLSSLFQPLLPLHMNSILCKTVIERLSNRIVNVAKWLIAAGIDIYATDMGQNTFLHHASQGGLISLIEYIVGYGNSTIDSNDSSHSTNNNDRNNRKAYRNDNSRVLLSPSEEYDLVNAVNNMGRSALHYAAAYGYSNILTILLHHQGNIHLKDIYGISPHDIIANSVGPISALDAVNMFHITQRPIKQVENRFRDRKEIDNVHDGWDRERLFGYESEYDICEIDQFEANEINGSDIFYRYLSRNSPILIRGLINDWKALDVYKKENILSRYGNNSVIVTDIPYPYKFGSMGRRTMKLKDYILFNSNSSRYTNRNNHNENFYPWYIFKSHPIPKQSENNLSFVPYDICLTPQTIYDLFRLYYPKNSILSNRKDVKSREMFINAQWAYGSHGTGASMHYHNTAWNALLYGAKKWFIYPPNHAMMSNVHIKRFIETDMWTYTSENQIKPITCTQLAGDVIIIPESWAHGVINLQESVAIATEATLSLWRMKPGTSLIDHVLQDRNRDD